MDPTTLRRARQVIDFLHNQRHLRDRELDALHECLGTAQQRDHLAEALAVVRAREADALEALRGYLAAHNAGAPCPCCCCAAARRALRR
jgi:hypothetical protein